jgi:hypothetical protein
MPCGGCHVDKNRKNTLWRSTLILRVSMSAASAVLMQASLQRTALAADIKCLRHFDRRRAINHNKQRQVRMGLEYTVVRT